MKPSTLITNRLILRSASPADDNLFKDYFSNSDNAIFLARKSHDDINQTKKVLNDWCSLPWNLSSNKFGWIVALLGSNKAIGIFLVELNESSDAQIHFGINSEYSKQGLITEAGIAVIEWLKNQKDIRKIWTICDLLNTGSIRVLDKIGLKNRGIKKAAMISPAFNNSPRDCYLYSSELS